MFDLNLTKVIPQRDEFVGPDRVKYLYLYIPSRSKKFSDIGLKLKNGMGSVSIEIIYKYLNKHDLQEIGHTFRYFSQEHTYTFSYEDSGEPENKHEDIGIYSFRYDKDLRPSASNDLEEHLQVLHNEPRFPINKVELKDFLLVVKQTCFNKDGGAIKTPFFANNR